LINQAPWYIKQRVKTVTELARHSLIYYPDRIRSIHCPCPAGGLGVSSTRTMNPLGGEGRRGGLGEEA
jgi:hypothetical protein